MTTPHPCRAVPPYPVPLRRDRAFSRLMPSAAIRNAPVTSTRDDLTDAVRDQRDPFKH